MAERGVLRWTVTGLAVMVPWAAAVFFCAAVVLAAAAVARAATPPPNDNYLSSTVIPPAATTGSEPVSYESVEDTSAATTQPDLFNPDQNGNPQSGGGAEPLSCHGASYGNTVWYDLHPRIPIGLELTTAGFPTVIAVYRWNPLTSLITEEVFCQASSSLENDLAIPFDLQKGAAYTVQVGGLQTSGGIASGALDFKATVYPDHDGDSVFDVIDDCPTLPGVQRYGGCPPSLHPIPRLDYTSNPGAARINTLQVAQVPAGAHVLARCRPCHASTAVNVRPNRSSAVLGGLQGRTLRAGDKLEIWVTKSRSGTGIYKYGAFGSYISYTVGSNGTLGKRTLRCLMPGSLTPRTTCPPGGRHRPTGHVR